MQEGSKDPRYKRPFDLVVLVAAHLILAPVWVLLWIFIPLAIWLDDRGPIFFRQQRVGRGGREITIVKFRTMFPGAAAAGLVTGERDPRVTRAGRFLRKTALDEIPQVLNIIRGDMSLVGPRALPVEMHNRAVKGEPNFPKRLQITPGMTGVAQLYLPRHCAPRRRLRYDIRYIRNASLWLDTRLIFRAVWISLSAGWGSRNRRLEVAKPDVRTHQMREGD